MFTSRTSHTSSLVYLSVTDQLVQHFLSQNGGASVTVSMGIDPADDRNVKLLTRVSARWRGGSGIKRKCIMGVLWRGILSVHVLICLSASCVSGDSSRHSAESASSS